MSAITPQDITPEAVRAAFERSGTWAFPTWRDARWVTPREICHAILNPAWDGERTKSSGKYIPLVEVGSLSLAVFRKHAAKLVEQGLVEEERGRHGYAYVWITEAMKTRSGNVKSAYERLNALGKQLSKALGEDGRVGKYEAVDVAVHDGEEPGTLHTIVRVRLTEAQAALLLQALSSLDVTKEETAGVLSTPDVT